MQRAKKERPQAVVEIRRCNMFSVNFVATFLGDLGM
jgi:hypothetical protein